MKKYLIITADENDADFITNKVEITDEDIEKIKPVAKALKDRHNEYKKTGDWELSTNWETGELAEDKTPKILYIEPGILTEEQVEIFNRFVPDNEYGIHTIENIDILVVSEEINLF